MNTFQRINLLFFTLIVASCVKATIPPEKEFPSENLPDYKITTDTNISTGKTIYTITLNKKDILSQNLTDSISALIQNLIIKGSVSNNDIYTIRDKIIDIENLDLSETILTSLPEYAFFTNNKGLHKLDTIILNDIITTIGKWAFADCISLKSINLPDNIKIIEEFVFYNCTSIITLSLPAKTEIIKNNAFRNCINISQINIPSGVTDIGEYAFKDCQNIKKNKPSK